MLVINLEASQSWLLSDLVTGRDGVPSPASGLTHDMAEKPIQAKHGETKHPCLFPRTRTPGAASLPRLPTPRGYGKDDPCPAAAAPVWAEPQQAQVAGQGPEREMLEVACRVYRQAKGANKQPLSERTWASSRKPNPRDGFEDISSTGLGKGRGKGLNGCCESLVSSYSQRGGDVSFETSAPPFLTSAAWGLTNRTCSCGGRKAFPFLGLEIIHPEKVPSKVAPLFAHSPLPNCFPRSK